MLSMKYAKFATFALIVVTNFLKTFFASCSSIHKQIYASSAARKFIALTLIKISLLYMEAKRIYEVWTYVICIGSPNIIFFLTPFVFSFPCMKYSWEGKSLNQKSYPAFIFCCYDRLVVGKNYIHAFIAFALPGKEVSLQ